MIGYLCKYAPVEILQSMGAEVSLIMPEASDFSRADVMLHPNICSFIKGVLETFADGDYEGIVLTNCCDSTRRLYDLLKKEYPDKFVHMAEIPRNTGSEAAEFLADSAKKLADAWESRSGCRFRPSALADLLRKRAEDCGENGGANRGGSCDEASPEAAVGAKSSYGEHRREYRPPSACGAGNESSPVKVGLMGARCSRSVLDRIESYDIHVLFDMTCTGVPRNFRLSGIYDGSSDSGGSGDFRASGRSGDSAGCDHAGESADSGGSAGQEAAEDTTGLLKEYASQLLAQIPCMRMTDCSPREEYLKSYENQLDGIIFHTVQFCDNYSYEYAALHGSLSVPIQKFETDATSQCEGQIRTRLEAFLESIAASKGLAAPQTIKKKGKKKRMSEKIHVLGIDSGSTSTNAVIMDGERRIEAYAVVRTGAKSGDSAERVLEEVLRKASLTREEIDLIVSTGYGRVSIPFADRNVTEISCHGKGAHYFNPSVRTVLDIGGQDSKAIRLNESGDVVDFVMNDKCAAGTGKFLEMMARTLEIDIEELGQESLRWKEDIDISSMCSVFAESEVISLIANNREKCDIAHGIHKSVANRSVSLMRRVGLEPGYMMTGGVAKNPGAVREIEEKLGEKLFICEEPEIVGAAGAALFGLEELQEKKR